MTWLWAIPIGSGIVFQVLILISLLKGFGRRFRVFFVYMTVLLPITVVNAAIFFDPEISKRMSRFYWMSDAVLQALVFVLVISLVHSGMGTNPGRAATRRWLVAGAFLFTAVSAVLTRDPLFGLWMTKLSRNLGFCAVLLNLVLWAVLIRNRHADRRLLLLSGGLGIEMAGKAIGHSLRELSPSLWLTGNLVVVLANVAALYIWWEAFRKKAEEVR